MKKTLTLFFLIAMTVTALRAQINFTRSDYGSNGDKVLYGVDTPSSASNTVGVTGPNKIWDFSTKVGANKYDSVMFFATTGDPNAPGAGANLLVRSASGGDQYFEVTSSFSKIIINQPALKVTGIKIKQMTFPFTYQSSMHDSVMLTVKGTFADFGYPAFPGCDSVRGDITVNTTSVCDGWGTLMLPSGNYPSLRVENTTVMSADIYIRTISTGQWSFFTNQSQTDKAYQWYGTNSKSYLASAATDPSGSTITKFTYKVLSIPTKVPNIVSVTPNYGERGKTLNVTISGTNTHFTQASSSGVFFSQGSSSLSINTINPVNDTTMNVNVGIGSSEALGLYDLLVSTPADGNMFFNSSFEVMAATSIPQIKTISPSTGVAGTTLNVTITGTNTHFTQGSSAVSFFAQGSATGLITVNSTTKTNDSVMVCSVTLSSTAKGKFGLTVFNTIDGNMGMIDAFTVTTVGIAEAGKNPELSLYPNPAGERFHIRCSEDIVAVRLRDITGRLVKEISAEAITFIDVSDMRPGVYLCTLSGKGFETTQKLLIQK